MASEGLSLHFKRERISSQECAVRVIIATLLIVYLIGVGVELAPSVWSGWSTGNGSRMVNNMIGALPDALAWPASAYRGIAGSR
jgi:hypothetical protein